MTTFVQLHYTSDTSIHTAHPKAVSQVPLFCRGGWQCSRHTTYTRGRYQLPCPVTSSHQRQAISCSHSRQLQQSETRLPTPSLGLRTITANCSGAYAGDEPSQIRHWPSLGAHWLGLGAYMARAVMPYARRKWRPLYRSARTGVACLGRRMQIRTSYFVAVDGSEIKQRLLIRIPCPS